MTVLLMAAALLATGMPPAAAAEDALRMLSAGRASEAAVLLDSLSLRMPHNHRLALDLAAALFEDSAFSAADSLVGGLTPGDGVLDVSSDTLSSAAAAASLAASMAAEDYGGVSAAADTLRSLISGRGDPVGVDAANLEAALLWLRSHRPPPPQEGGGGDSPQDQGQDESQDDGQGGEDRQQPEEQDRPDDRREEDVEAEVPQAPEEMTPETARRILDMVEEASPEDTLKAGAAGGRLSW